MLNIICNYRHNVENSYAKCNLFKKENPNYPEATVHEQACQACLKGRKEEVFKGLKTCFDIKGYFLGDENSPFEIMRLCPPPINRIKPINKIRWITAVVTAPRKENYLEGTCKSIVKAGFPKPIIFAEPNSVVPTGYDVVRWPKWVGVYQNSLMAMQHCFLARGIRDWDAILLCEDDVKLSLGLRDYLDETLWPCDPKYLGYISVYSNNSVSNQPSGWNRVTECVGAQALILSKECLGRYIFDAFHLTHIEDSTGSVTGENYQDQELFRWVTTTQKPSYILTGPGGGSFVEHVGLVSTLFAKQNNLQKTYIGNPLAEERIEVCLNCDQWNYDGIIGEDRCYGCGCARPVRESTLRNPNNKCPKNLWRR